VTACQSRCGCKVFCNFFLFQTQRTPTWMALGPTISCLLLTRGTGLSLSWRSGISNCHSDVALSGRDGMAPKQCGNCIHLMLCYACLALHGG
jgi:hypothetical protein